MGLRVHREVLGEALILVLEGRLDAESGEDLELAFHEVASQPCSTLLIDFGELAYASAAGIDKLRQALARVPDASSVRLCSPRAEIRAVLESADLRLPIFPSREEALSTQRLRRELALVDAVAAILRPPRVNPAALPDTLIDQAARLLGLEPASRGPTAPPSAASRDEPARATWVAERPSILMRRPPAKKRHPFIRWLRRLIGERD